jgi:hypothetical protein
MVRWNNLESKQKIFATVVNCLKDPKNSSLTILRLFKKLINDQKDRASTISSSASKTTTPAMNTTGKTATYSGSSNVNPGVTVISYSATQSLGATEIINTCQPQEQAESGDTAGAEADNANDKSENIKGAA